MKQTNEQRIKMKEPKGWYDLGNGKYEDSSGVFWMCGCCLKIFRTEKGYNHHLFYVRCKDYMYVKKKRNKSINIQLSDTTKKTLANK